MKSLKSIVTLLSVLVIVSCTNTSIVWDEGETDPDTGLAIHHITIVNPPAGTDWCVWFAAHHIEPVIQEGSEAAIERFNGCMYRILPNSEHGQKSLEIYYEEKPLPRQCWAPEGFSLQQGDKSRQLKTIYNYLPAQKLPDFDYTPQSLTAFDMIPALKKYAIQEGVTVVNATYPAATIVEGKPAGWYRIVLDGKLSIEAADEDGAYFATVTLDNIRRNSPCDTISNVEIEDWPDLPYRGFMLDVSRNFTNKDGILKLIDVLSHYKVNVLHLHLGDDEGWRMEIEDIPELATFGARHELPHINADGTYEEVNGLIPSFSGKIALKDPANSGNGCYTHEEFVEILRYAWAHRMRVVPEFDSPGHSRAAIKALEKYARRTGDESYLMSEKADTSKYVSVQYYTDNAINVALPSTYKFFAKVFDTLIEYYREAGAPLEQVHIGGDEVPSGAWMGSPACQALMAENGWTEPVCLKSYFVENLTNLLAERGLKLAGWQEVVTGITPETYQRIKSKLGNIYVWNARVRGNLDQLPYTLANDGIQVILSNMTNAYIDFAYNPGKLEMGHSWGGFVDERRSFSLAPYDIYRSVRWKDDGLINDIATLPEGKMPLKAKENIVGVQGQLWSETIRCFDNVTYFIFPKAVGLFERGWNASPAWEGSTISDCPEFTADFNRFYSIIEQNEMPYYRAVGICYKEHQSAPEQKYILQVCTGGWNNQNYTPEQIIERLDKVSGMIPVEKVIIGWNLNADLYKKVGEYLHSKGVKMILWMPVFSEIGHLEQAQQSVDLWGVKTEPYNLQEGEDFTFYCPSSPENVAAVKSIYEKHFAECGFDGVFLDKIRTASYVAGQSGVLSCGCPRCLAIYAEKGLDVEALKAKAEMGFDTDDSEMKKFLKIKAEIVAKSVGELEEWFHAKGMEVGLDLFAPALARIVGQDFKALSENADFVKPMMYRKTEAPAGIGFEMRAFDPQFDYGSLTAKYLYKELCRAAEFSRCPVYPGIEVNYREDIAKTSPEYIVESLQMVRKAGLPGAVLAWDIMLAPDSHIEAVASL